MIGSLKPSATVAIPWTDVTRFVRQLSHDLRNTLNAMELQSAYLAELVETAELKGEVKRLRAMTAEFGDRLGNVTNAMASITLQRMPYKAVDFIEDAAGKIASLHPTERENVKWDSSVAAGAMLDIDPQLLQQALMELFANAFQHRRGEGTIELQATTDEEALILRLIEPKNAVDFDVARWGQQPLHSIGAGRYGLGLFRARGIIEAHGGILTARLDEKSRILVSTVVLPLAPAV